MPLPPEPTASTGSDPNGAGRRWAAVFDVWSRKLHYYSGLYFLLFLWLFAGSGLLLNHSQWRFAEFWSNRRVATAEHPIEPPTQTEDLARARDLMRQLGVTGEIEWTTPRSDPGRFDFRVIRPGQMWEIKTDLVQKRATLEHTRINAWGILRVLHTFTGVRADDPRAQRDWLATSIWSLCMDGVAVGLVFMVLSSLSMWWGMRPKRRLGAAALGLGIVACGFFVWGLRWLTP